jgi:hypothetical protein
MSTKGTRIAVCELWRRRKVGAFVRIRAWASLRRVIRDTVDMVNMTEGHKCSCTGDCSEAVRTKGELCEKCAAGTNDGCCELDNTKKSDDDSGEDDARHDGRQGDAYQGKTTPGRERVDTQRISPAARWSGMDTRAWLKTLGAMTSLQYGTLTARLA